MGEEQEGNCNTDGSLFLLKRSESIEGFSGKRAQGFLFKNELCQKRSKFRMQFCLRVSNNALYVFPLKFASFLKYYVCEKTFFQGHSLGTFC